MMELRACQKIISCAKKRNMTQKMFDEVLGPSWYIHELYLS